MLTKFFCKQPDLPELLSMCEHRNGYKREKAVKSLGNLGNPIAISKLIIRANDWVPQVRSAATDAILKLAVSDNAKVFVQHLSEFYHLKKCSRNNNNQLINSIESFLLENVEYVLQGIHNDNYLIARICVSLTIKNKLINLAKLMEKIITHPDITIRIKGVFLS